MISKLIKIQSELKAPKNQENKFGGFKYRSCEDILEALKPLLSKYELLLTLNDEIIMIGNRYYVQATAKVTDSSGEYIQARAFARESEEKAKMDSSQVTGSASSYARKYALNGLFCIDDTKDQDFYDNSSNRVNAPLKLKKKQVDEIIKGCLEYEVDINLILNTFRVNNISDLTLAQYNSIMNNFERKKQEKSGKATD